MKFLRIEKSPTSAKNVVLTIVTRDPLFGCDECHRIEVSRLDLNDVLYESSDAYVVPTRTVQGL